MDDEFSDFLAHEDWEEQYSKHVRAYIPYLFEGDEHIGVVDIYLCP